MITLQDKKIAYKKLPEKLQDYIASNEIIEKVELIASKFSLSSNQKNLLDSELTILLLGLQNEDEFIKSLQNNVQLNEDTSLAINHEVTSNILIKIRELIPVIIKAGEKTKTTTEISVLGKVENKKTIDNPELKAGTNLIEDSAGNADNVLPPLPGEKEVTPVAEALRPIEPKQTVPNSPNIKIQKPEPALSDAEWEARKKALEAGELVMKTAYGQKPDPYREPLG